MNTSHINDFYHRPLQDLRISVTDRCNLRCHYCMPEHIFNHTYPYLKKSELLSFEEITHLTKIFVKLGVKKIRITGGEPLLRKNIEKLVNQLHSIDGIQDLALTTNGILLPEKARLLKEAGLKRVNISLDALNQQTLQRMNGIPIQIDDVLAGIYAAKNAGLAVKINMVIMKGINEHEIIPMATYFKKEQIPLRFIEFMDVGCSNKWDLSKVVTKKEILSILQNHFQLSPITSDNNYEVATRYLYKDTLCEVGIISSITEAFCGTCTRGRISANGQFYTCLFANKGYDLKSELRKVQNDADLETLITSIWSNRMDRYSEERLQLLEKKAPQKKIEMSYIGG